MSGPVELKSSTIKVEFNSKGNLNRFEFFEKRLREDFEERFTYYGTNARINRTRSGLYIFNPRHQKKEIEFDSSTLTYTEITGLVYILQVHHRNSQNDVLKTYIVNLSGCPNLKKQLFTEIQIISQMTAEISYDLKKVHKSKNSEFKAYADDSMKLVERPIFDSKAKIKHTNEFELNGYFTSACVHGGMLRESYNDSKNDFKESFFGWANSNPIGCTFADKGEVDIMVFRTLGNNDRKGVVDLLRESHVTSTAFQFFIDNSVNGVMFHKVRADTKINAPYAIFTNHIKIEDIVKYGEKGLPRTYR